MHKSLSLIKGNSSSKAEVVHLQTEELIADMRSVMTPSQRVDEKLAACSGFSRTLLTRRDEFGHAPRRPR